MANEQNLKPFTSDQNREEAAKNGRKGGVKSGEARRKRKAMREAFDELLEKSYIDAVGNQIQGVEAIATKVFKQALDGDMKAVQFIRDTVGEMPAQRIETVEIPQEVYDRVESAFGDNM